MTEKLTGRALAQFEAGRDIWQEVLDGVREIKAGGGKRVLVEPGSRRAASCGTLRVCRR